MRKRIIIIPVFIIFVCTIAFCISHDKIDYKRAEKEAIKFLNRHSELENVSKNAINMELCGESHQYKGKKYYYCIIRGKRCAKIEINARGFLGGQYWSLIYCEDDLLEGREILVYDENKETGRGNNIYVTKKIGDNWYFYYEDFDGKIDTTDI